MAGHALELWHTITRPFRQQGRANRPAWFRLLLVTVLVFQVIALAYNLGQVFLTSGQPDAAFEWLAWGVEHERAVGKTFLSEQRAVHLFEAGRRDEAAAVWRELLASGLLEEKSRAAIEHNLRVASGPA